MWRWLSPLAVFVIGMTLVLIVTIFFPGIDTAVSSTQSAISGYSDSYWGVNNILGSSKLIVFGVGLGFVLFSTFMVWLKRR